MSGSSEYERGYRDAVDNCGGCSEDEIHAERIAAADPGPSCGTCKHWDPKPDDGVAHEGVCKRVDDRYWDEQGGSGGAVVLVSALPSARAVPFLLTQSDFGCIDFAGRPTTSEDPQ